MLLVIVVIIFLLMFIVPKIIKEKLANKLTEYILKRDFDSFDTLINKRYVYLFFNPFNVDFMKMNKALAKGDEKEIDDAFINFDNCRLSDKQKLAVYYNAFYYYISINNISKTKSYGNKLLNLNIDDELKEEIKKYYAVFIDKSYIYLEDDLKKLEANDLQNEEKSKIAFLISKMYENKGDSALAKSYLDKSISYLK